MVLHRAALGGDPQTRDGRADISGIAADASGWCRYSGSVIGDEFPAVLGAAQDGNEDAFATLWRDGNPALLRYLRVVCAG